MQPPLVLWAAVGPMVDTAGTNDFLDCKQKCLFLTGGKDSGVIDGCTETIAGLSLPHQYHCLFGTGCGVPVLIQLTTNPK